MLQQRATSALRCSGFRPWQSPACLSTSALRFSDPAPNPADLPHHPKSSFGGLLTRSSNRPISPSSSARSRPARQQRPQDGRGNSNILRTRQPQRVADSGGRIIPEKIQPSLEPAFESVVAADGKERPAHLKSGSGERDQKSEQAVNKERTNDETIHRRDSILPETNLTELFARQIYSARHTKGRGGDYFGYLPPTLTRSPGGLGPVERAQLTLGRNRQIPLESKNRVLDIIRRSTRN